MKTLHKVISILLIACTLLNLSAPVMAAEIPSGRRIVKVGLFPFAGYHEKNKDGQIEGYGFDILQQMLIHENWKYEYIGYDENISWNDAQDLLASGEIDLLTSATMNEERLEKYDYSDIPIGTSSTMITAKAGDNRFDTNNYDAWNNVRIGLLSGNSRNESFQAYAKEHAFTYQPIEMETSDELELALNTGRLDMIVTSNLLKLSGIRVVDQFDEKPFYVIVKKGNTRLLSEVNDALTDIQSQDSDFAKKLYLKYYKPDSNGVVAFTQKEQQYINDCNKNGVVFTAVINTDRKPLAYDNSGTVSGLLVDMSKIIFERTGLHIEFVPDLNRKEYIQTIENQEPDIICDFTNTQSSADTMGYVLTSPYYNSSISMLVKNGYSGHGKVCALTKNSITKSKVEGQEGISYLYFDSNKECQDAVRSGDADFTYSYTRSVQDTVYSDITHSFACVTVPDFSCDFSMAINLKDDSYLSSILNKSVDSITEADTSFTSEPYTYYDRTTTSILSTLYDHPLIAILLVISIAIILVFLVLFYMSKKRHLAELKVNQQLAAALKAEAQANESKTAFLSRISHDMRTPLNGILGLASLLRDQLTEPSQVRDIEQLQISGEYLLNLVNDTLDVSRIEHQKLELHPILCDEPAVLKNIISLLQPVIDQKHIQFTLTEKTNYSHPFIADAVRIEQVFMNILSNALKFTPDGGHVELVVNSQEINEKEVYFDITVKDDGIGMDEEFIPRIFEPFAQADSSKKNTFQGTGLGMTISKEIIKLMDGDIHIDSKPGEGTSVNFSFHVQIATEEQIEQWKKENAKVISDTSLTGKRILLCEDHPLNAQIATRLLEKESVVVEHAENGRIGLEMFCNSTPGHFDAILMDIRMPVMDGLETTRAIRSLSRPDAHTIPIIAMTANALSSDVQECISAGMNAHIGKPIEPAHLYAVLKEYTVSLY